MSNIYVTEPATSGKVLLRTTIGDIDIELWTKEAPLACRNFLQLCMENYFDGCLFHRVVTDFIAQTGDPTGTGEGGESIWGKDFKDEPHTRLKFKRRGLVAMANIGDKPNSNGSQFFFTLGATEELQGKHTIFGKVAGDTIYNMIKLNELELEPNSDRPVHPPKIISSLVLSNPFDDILPREKKIEKEEEPVVEAPKKKKKKNLNLLSFGEEQGEEDNEMESFIKSKKSVSVHHDEGGDDEEALEAARKERKRERLEKEEKEQRLRDAVSGKSDMSVEEFAASQKAKLAKKAEQAGISESKRKHLEEIKRIKGDIDDLDQRDRDYRLGGGKKEEDSDEEGLTPLQKMQLKYRKKNPVKKVMKRKNVVDDSLTQMKLKQFRDNLLKKTEKEVGGIKEATNEQLIKMEDLRQKKMEEREEKVKNNIELNDSDEEDEPLVFSKLKFLPQEYVLAKDPSRREMYKDDGYDVFDPLITKGKDRSKNMASQHHRRLYEKKRVEKW
eukprot:TRINITY_DN5409_c0_g1_i1.p1 TRINITY_DN5409_c0_g1~~TRINITY_DN5409_c0_g1_i1.p1  ORF type:complete len:499 (-),score=162.82 TRINITY_DN5409_c0_g1_i1:11-1507(-)